jgi:outer membrane receptor protein involved in Fe transport
MGGRSRLRGNGLLPDAMAQEDVRAAYSYPDVTRNRMLQLQASVVHRFDPRTEFSATAYTRRSRRNTVNGDVELDDGELEGAFNTTATRQNGHGASALLSMRRPRHRIDVGATFDRSGIRFEQFGQEGILSDQREVLPQAGADPAPGSSVSGSSRIVGAFISDTWSVAAATHITASARWNHALVSNTLTSALGLQPAESFTYTKLNPALGIAHDVGGGVIIGASIAQGNRVPTVIELGCADPQQPCQLPVALQSDPYLRQVVSRTVETGARYRRQGVSASISLYRTVNRDDILFLSSGLTRLGYFANFERTRHQGADVAASTAAGGLTLHASYSYLDAVYDAPGVLFTGVRTVRIARGTPLAGLPRHTLKLGADWQAGAAFKLGAEVQALSSLPTQGNEDGLATDSLPGHAPQSMDLRVRGHAVMSARVEWVPAVGWEVYARVANLFDRRYASFGAVARDVFSEAGREGQNSRFVAPGAPRSVSFGVRYRY